MLSLGMLRRVALVRTDVSAERRASIIRLTRIGELVTLAVTSKQCTLRYVPPKRPFLQEPHGVTSRENLKSYEDFSVCHCVHTGSRAQLVSSPMGAG
jgi:hypothetical protein